MYIKLKLKLNQKQEPYWVAYLINNGTPLAEIRGNPFPINNMKEYWDSYERTTVRMAKTIAEQADQAVLQHMLLEEDNNNG
jgi:hypothetical protein